MATQNKAFKKTVFPNGLTLVTERHPEFKSLSLGVWVKTGTRHEDANEAGMSHFLEHMLFKGTRNRTAVEIAREVDQVGGDFNAFTAREYTCFHFLLLARDEALGFDILNDVLLHSLFEPEEIGREKKVVLQELSMVEESPEEFVHDLFYERVFGDHSLGKPILGTSGSVRRFTRATVVEFFRKHYHPERMVISVTGDIAHETAIRRIKPLVRARMHRKLRVAPARLGRPVFHSFRDWLVRPSEQSHLIWGAEGPHYTDPDRFAFFLINTQLGGGMSSSLFQEIREKNGLAYTVYSSLSPFYDSGVFSVYVATNPAQVSQCLRLIDKCVDDLKQRLLSRSELRSIKDNLQGTLLLGSDNVEARMSSIAKNEIFFGRNIPVEEVCRKLEAVTAEQIRSVARRFFDPARVSLQALGSRPDAKARQRLGFRFHR